MQKKKNEKKRNGEIWACKSVKIVPFCAVPSSQNTVYNTTTSMCKSALARYELISSLSAGIKALFPDLRQHSTHVYTYIAMGSSVKRL